MYRLTLSAHGQDISYLLTSRGDADALADDLASELVESGYGLSLAMVRNAKDRRGKVVMTRLASPRHLFDSPFVAAY